LISLKYANLSTVSRAGIIYMAQSDLGWTAFVSSWIEKNLNPHIKANMGALFDKYLPTCLEASRLRFKHIVPLTEFEIVQLLCLLLESLLGEIGTIPAVEKDAYETYFVFAAVWAFGGALLNEAAHDYRIEFSNWWKTEFVSVKFPYEGTVFEYCIEKETKKWTRWEEIFKVNASVGENPIGRLVFTPERIRTRYFIDRCGD
jgi:dynein heavy chain